MSELECIECSATEIEKESISKMATEFECQECGHTWRDGIIGG